VPLQTRFHRYEPDRPPTVVGVYELAWGDYHVVYIGSGSIRRRLRCHRRDDEKRFHSYRCIRVCDRRRARQIERREQRAFRDRNGRLPAYNDRVG
jgi:hypothetical protein